MLHFSFSLQLDSQAPHYFPAAPVSGSAAWPGVIVSLGTQINGFAVELLRDLQTREGGGVGGCFCPKGASK